MNGGDVRVYDALDQPRSTREITTVLRQKLQTAWGEEHGIEIEFNERGMPTEMFVPMLTLSWANARGYPYLNAQAVYRHLKRLEKQGKAWRIQVPGHRPMLWTSA